MVTGTDITEEKAVSDTGLQTLDSRNTLPGRPFLGPSGSHLGQCWNDTGQALQREARGGKNNLLDGGKGVCKALRWEPAVENTEEPNVPEAQA